MDKLLVVTGSHNWSISANYNNDEAIVAINNPVVAAHFQREFDRLFDTAILGPTTKLKQSAPSICPHKLKDIFKPENQTGVAKTLTIESDEVFPNE
jgi:phosphatidylserine/phosphatidylglycerophosphate/cardiolipin synthase-like enzyme